MLSFQFRPIDKWPLPPGKRENSQFKATWLKTLDLLEHELRHLGAKEIVIQADVTLAMIRNDGMLRGDARPNSPRVILSFESKHGPLSYPCDRFTAMQDNIRAIALGLEALRKVERYGITQRGEQYKGWERIAGPVAGMAPADAQSLLSAAAGISGTHIKSAEMLEHVYRMAASRTHPDAGGNPEAFKKVVQAKEVLDKHFGRNP